MEPPTATVRGDLLVAAAGVGRQQDLGPLELAGRLLAPAQHRAEFTAFGLAQFDPIPYIHRGLLRSEAQTNRPMNQKSGTARRSSDQGFTEKQGQYLAFIYAYTRMFRRPPAEADMQRHFRVTPPSVHQMVLTLERAGLIRRQPGVARSIELLVAAEDLPTVATSRRSDNTSAHDACRPGTADNAAPAVGFPLAR